MKKLIVFVNIVIILQCFHFILPNTCRSSHCSPNCRPPSTWTLVSWGIIRRRRKKQRVKYSVWISHVSVHGRWKHQDTTLGNAIGSARRGGAPLPVESHLFGPDHMLFLHQTGCHFLFFRVLKTQEMTSYRTQTNTLKQHHLKYNIICGWSNG